MSFSYLCEVEEVLPHGVTDCQIRVVLPHGSGFGQEPFFIWFWYSKEKRDTLVDLVLRFFPRAGNLSSAPQVRIAFMAKDPDRIFCLYLFEYLQAAIGIVA